MTVFAGKIFGTHGLKGNLKATLHLELKAPCPVELRFSNGAKKPLVLGEVSGTLQHAFLKFEGVDNPEDARAYTLSEVWLEREKLPELQNGSYYAADLIGLSVVDEGRGMLGKVSGLIETGSNACLEIQPPGGESYLIPMIDQVIVSIGEEVKVRLLKGLHPDETEEV